MPMNRQEYIESLDPDDIVERLRATDGAIITIQRYRDGHSWICHGPGCGSVGTDGEWTEWTDHFHTKYPDRPIGAGKLWEAQHGAEGHGREKHGGISA